MLLARQPKTSRGFKYVIRVSQLVHLLHEKASFVRWTQCPAFIYNTAAPAFFLKYYKTLWCEIGGTNVLE